LHRCPPRNRTNSRPDPGLRPDHCCSSRRSATEVLRTGILRRDDHFFFSKVTIQ
jgi:hypothetical protein